MSDNVLVKHLMIDGQVGATIMSSNRRVVGVSVVSSQDSGSRKTTTIIHPGGRVEYMKDPVRPTISKREGVLQAARNSRAYDFSVEPVKAKDVLRV